MTGLTQGSGDRRWDVPGTVGNVRMGMSAVVLQDWSSVERSFSGTGKTYPVRGSLLRVPDRGNHLHRRYGWVFQAGASVALFGVRYFFPQGAAPQGHCVHEMRVKSGRERWHVVLGSGRAFPAV